MEHQQSTLDPSVIEHPKWECMVNCNEEYVWDTSSHHVYQSMCDLGAPEIADAADTLSNVFFSMRT